MTPQTEIIRRHADGSLDIGFYARRAAAMRMAERRAAPRRWLAAVRRFLRLG
jgi:hypothetical protein